MPRTHHRLRALAALAAVVLLLASCARGASPEGASSRSRSTSTASAPSDRRGPAGHGGTLARYASYRSVAYRDRSHWMCRPDTADACDAELDSTELGPRGTTTVERFHADPHAPVDCFYVYPTISRDPGDRSDWHPGSGEEEFVAIDQAARLASTCRLYVPLYRQLTVAGLARMFGGSHVRPDVAYPDVLDAFRSYMAHDNHGRGVVLVGHSQGSILLLRLLHDEIDPHPDVRAKLVSAVIPGVTLERSDSSAPGNRPHHIGECRRADQVGCIVTWNSRLASGSADGALYGRAVGSSKGAVCVSPARLVGHGDRLHLYGPSGFFGAQPGAELTTPFASTRREAEGRCVTRHGVSFLAVDLRHQAGTGGIESLASSTLTGPAGAHLVDLNLVLGDVVELVGREAKAFTR